MTQPRRMMVLRAVVEDYIRSQEPVGSASLARNHRLGVSSATIRNDMAMLEEEGYLIQPHTSAGRVPSERGYRCFVDHLAQVVPLDEARREQIRGTLSDSVSMHDSLQRAARALARITGQLAVIASPALSKATLRHLELIPIASATLLAVVITDTGTVAQRMLQVHGDVDADSLRDAIRLVNVTCEAMPLSGIADRLETLAANGHIPQSLGQALAQALAAMSRDEEASELFVAGASRLAGGHADASELASLFDAIEERAMLMRLMLAVSRHTDHDGVGVAIGSETHSPALIHASVVSSGYGQASNPDAQPREPVAFIASIGPTHMDYTATMAAVAGMAAALTAFIDHEEPTA